MSNERALTIVESAQSPVVVVVSSVSAAEIEYQKMARVFKATIDQLRVIGKQRLTARANLAKAWLDENYPKLRHTVTTDFADHGYSDINYSVVISIESPRESEILRELKAYFA